VRPRFIPHGSLADQDGVWAAAEQGRGASRRALNRRLDRREGIWDPDTDRFAILPRWLDGSTRPQRSLMEAVGNDAAFRVSRPFVSETLRAVIL
jgi:hypothetical protein